MATAPHQHCVLFLWHTLLPAGSIILTPLNKFQQFGKTLQPESLVDIVLPCRQQCVPYYTTKNIVGGLPFYYILKRYILTFVNSP